MQVLARVRRRKEAVEVGLLDEVEERVRVVVARVVEATFQ